MSWSLFSAGQGWPQFAALALAFALSSLIGLEREFRMRVARACAPMPWLGWEPR